MTMIENLLRGVYGNGEQILKRDENSGGTTCRRMFRAVIFNDAGVS
jgi:hypothetical protein